MKIKIEFAKKEVKALQSAAQSFRDREDEFNAMVGLENGQPETINKNTVYWEKSQNEDGNIEVSLEINKDWAVKVINLWTESFDAAMNFVFAVAPAIRLFVGRMKKSNAKLDAVIEELVE
jgi:hypothetical protein